MKAALPTQLEQLSLTIGREQIDMYAQMSGDFNPIHMDAIAAAEAGMSGVIAHGTLSMNLIWEAIEKTFSSLQTPQFHLAVRFKAPVYLDETIETGGLATQGAGNYQVWVKNQAGEKVIEGNLTIKY